MVGQSVPDCGREGAAGVAVVVGPGVPVQVQLVLDVHDGFLQKPPEQIRFDAQLLLLPQVPLQVLGVPEGLGVAVGVVDGVTVGVPLGVGDPVGVNVGVGVATANVKERAQVVTSAAFGMLDGTFGATGS